MLHKQVKHHKHICYGCDEPAKKKKKEEETYSEIYIYTHTHRGHSVAEGTDAINMGSPYLYTLFLHGNHCRLER